MLRTRTTTALASLMFLAAAALFSQPGRDPLSRGDGAWEHRAAMGPEAGPDPEAIATAVAAYAEAVEQQPEHLEPRWKLLRALHFRADFLETDREAKREVLIHARDLAEAALNQVAAHHGGREAMDDLVPEQRAHALAATGSDLTDLAQVFFWSAVVWGQWGETVGHLTAARQGLAGRLRDLAETALALDEGIEGAGPHRFLGRLHAVAPKIPLVTGWVSRQLALDHLRRGVELAPDEPENALFLAEAILEHRRREHEQARRILLDLADRAPRAAFRLEDERTLAAARELLGTM